MCVYPGAGWRSPVGGTQRGRGSASIGTEDIEQCFVFCAEFTITCGLRCATGAYLVGRARSRRGWRQTGTDRISVGICAHNAQRRVLGYYTLQYARALGGLGACCGHNETPFGVDFGETLSPCRMAHDYPHGHARPARDAHTTRTTHSSLVALHDHESRTYNDITDETHTAPTDHPS